MKKSTLLLSVCIGSLYAQIGTFYGEVGASYEDEVRNSTTKVQETIRKNYFGLGYRDYAYSPNLLTYDVYGKIEQDKKTATGNDNKTDYEYNLNLNFFQRTYFPFKINAEKKLNEVVIVNNNNSSKTEEDRESFYIDGRYFQDTMWLNYYITSSATKQKAAFSVSQQDNKRVSIEVGDKFFNNDVSLLYSYELLNSEDFDELSTNLKDTDSVKNELKFSLKSQVAKLILNYKNTDHQSSSSVDGSDNYIEDNYRLDYTYDLAENLSFFTNADMTENSNNSENFLANIGTSWKPTNQIDTYTNVLINSVKFEDTTTDLLDFSFDSTYNYSDDLFIDFSTNNFFLSTNTLSGNDYLSGTLGVSYTKWFSEKYRYNIYLKTVASSNKYENPDDYDKTAVEYSIDNNFDIFFSSDTKLNFNFIYADMYTSLAEVDNNIDFKIDFSSIFLKKIRYNISTEYFYRHYEFFDSFEKDLKLFEETKWISEFDSNYGFDMNQNSSLNLSLNAKYVYEILPAVKRILTLEGKTSFKYRVLRELFYRLDGTIRSDSDYYNSMDYSVTNTLDYTYRKFNISLSNDYWARSSNQTGKENQIKTMLELSRIF